MAETKCKGCGKPMRWATTIAGRHIPLDASVPTYTIDERGKAIKSEAMVSHFTTCPMRDRFSKSKSQPITDAPERP